MIDLAQAAAFVGSVQDVRAAIVQGNRLWLRCSAPELAMWTTEVYAPESGAGFTNEFAWMDRHDADPTTEEVRQELKRIQRDLDAISNPAEWWLKLLEQLRASATFA